MWIIRVIYNRKTSGWRRKWRSLKSRIMGIGLVWVEDEGSVRGESVLGRFGKGRFPRFLQCQHVQLVEGPQWVEALGEIMGSG